MGTATKGERVLGPYRHRGRWRIIGKCADGSVVRRSYETYEEAKAEVDRSNAALGTATVGGAVMEYLNHLRLKGKRESTIRTDRYRLEGFFRLSERDIMLADLTPARVASLYSARTHDVKPDTHQGELVLARAFCAHLVKQGKLEDNPCADIEPMGQKATGKEQLRLDEARRFLAAALGDRTAAGLACALCLLTGARASEVTDRVVRDVDDRGRVLWITGSKTRAGVRQLVVPDLIAGKLHGQCAGKAATDRLWGNVDRHWLAYHVRRLCRVAGVPEVSPHGLRGVHATIARLSGVAATAVASALGQTSAGVTRRHYFAPGSDQSADTIALTDRLTTPDGPEPANDSDDTGGSDSGGEKSRGTEGASDIPRSPLRILK